MAGGFRRFSNTSLRLSAVMESGIGAGSISHFTSFQKAAVDGASRIFLRFLSRISFNL
jgi:hypothetical protein